MRRLILASAIALLPLAAQAGAPAYSTVYAFGDSLSDGGNAYLATGGAEPVSPPYAGVVSNGPVWVQDLAVALGLPAPAASLAGGTDFAVGGAESGTTAVHSAGLGDLPWQIAAFTAVVKAGAGVADANALYTLSIGGNDLTNALTGLQTGALTPLQVVQTARTAAHNAGDALGALAALGARHFVVLTVPDLGVVPIVTAQGPAASAAAYELTRQFNGALLGRIARLQARTGASVAVVHGLTLLRRAVQHPSWYGFTDATDPCWTGSYRDAASGTVCADPGHSLFWDREHPTAAAHALIARAALTALGL